MATKEKIKSGYKPSRFGSIPIDWEISFLKDVVDDKRTIRYGIVQPGVFDENGRYLVRGQDYSFGWVEPKQLFKVSDEIEIKYKNARIKTGDIILTIVGAGTGTVAIVPEWLDGANITQTTARIAINPAKADTNFCYYFLNSEKGKKLTYENIKGGAQPGLNCGDIDYFELPYPPLPEQRTIAKLLITWDKAINSLENIIVQKEIRKKWLIQMLLTGKKRLKGFTLDWRTCPLVDIANFLNGKAYKQEELLDEGKYKVLRVGNFFTNSNWYYSDLELEDDKYVSEGDLMYAWSASFGPRFWKGAKTIYHYHIWKVIPSEFITKQFLFYFLVFDTDKIFNNKQGGTMFHITKGDMEKRKIKLPNIEEQTAIANVLQATDRELQSLKNKLEKLKEQKKGLMQILLTGKKRITIKK